MNSKKYIIGAIVLIAGFCNRQAMAQTPGFVQQDIIKVSGITTDTSLYNLGPTQRQTTKVYVDGLGRQLQTIAEQASPTEKDIIQPIVYDTLGRQVTGYLPYGGAIGDVSGSYRANALTAQAAFYNQTSQYLIPVDINPYSKRIFENSPLQRLMDAGMFGAGFQPTGGHYKKVNYRPDSTTDGSIMLWYTNGTYSGSSYASKTLQVTDATDEDGIEFLTFTDKMGHVILKRQKSGSTNYDTYYIYNNAGMISYVIPPLAVSKLAANGNSLTAAAIASLIFKYQYNSHGQLTQRTIPGKGVMYIVYDPLNRPVLMQDSNMRVNHTWNYIKYDAKARVISQGIYTDASRTTLAAMQAHVDSLNYGTYWYETRNSSATYMYYTNNVFPTTNATALAYAYFDDYNMTGSATFAYVPQNDVSLPGEESPTGAMVKGMPTAVTKTIVGSGLSSSMWLTSAVFYDRNLHVIQQQSNNQLNYTNATTVTDFKTVVNDFTGMPLNSKVTRKRTSSDTVSVYTSITYDQVYRVTKVTQKYNTGPNNPVAAYSYNELGQLILKNLGYVSSGSWLQNEDFRYNINGWLLSINNSKLTPDGGKTNNDSNDVFGMQLMYDKADSALVNTKHFNGKPSGVKWMTRNYRNTRTNERSYLFNYNGFNRYTGENYAERDSTSTGTSPYTINLGAFNEKYIGYDVNGNITQLSRYSTNPAGGIYQIDTLKYTYSTTNGNQLLKVTDGTDSVHTNHGFRSIDSTANYQYDGNGNLYNDHFKGMELRYDVLNRTDKITMTAAGGQSIDYTYDADGNLLRKRTFSGGTLQTTTDYIDGFAYLTAGTGTPALSYFPMPEGRVLYTSPNTFTQEFILTDQQGNARVAFRSSGTGPGAVAKVFQENSYYGTGLILPNSPVSTPTVANKKLYNGGSEWQNDSPVGSTNPYNLPDYYETFNRNYDATIGRFIGVDPMAESAESMTSYQYGACNPIVNNDPMGDLSQAQWAFFVNQYKNGINGNFGASSDGTDNVYTTDNEGNNTGSADPNNAGGGTSNGGDIGGPGGGNNGVTKSNSVSGNRIRNAIDDAISAGLAIAGVGDNIVNLPEVYITDWSQLLSKVQTEAYAYNDTHTLFYGVQVHYSETSTLRGGGGYTLPGYGITISKTHATDLMLLRHEFGHILEARVSGYAFFYQTIIPASLWSAWIHNNSEHMQYWTEIEANTLSYYYFGQPDTWDFKNYPILQPEAPPSENPPGYDNIELNMQTGFH
jgi:RHS repeat-associated protein